MMNPISIKEWLFFFDFLSSTEGLPYFIRAVLHTLSNQSEKFANVSSCHGIQRAAIIDRPTEHIQVLFS